MAKVNAINPISGNKMDLSLGGIGGLILGSLLLLGVWGTTQKIAAKAEEKINNPLIDLTPNALSSGEVKVVNQKVYRG
jgi:uncharacterized transporter YbjL